MSILVRAGLARGNFTQVKSGGKYIYIQQSEGKKKEKKIKWQCTLDSKIPPPNKNTKVDRRKFHSFILWYCPSYKVYKTRNSP